MLSRLFLIFFIVGIGIQAQTVLDGIYVKERNPKMKMIENYPIVKKRDGVIVKDQLSAIKNNECHNTYLFYGDHFSLYQKIIQSTFDGFITPYSTYNLKMNKGIIGFENASVNDIQDAMFTYIDFKRNVDSSDVQPAEFLFRELLFESKVDTQRRIYAVGIPLIDTIWYSFDELQYLLVQLDSKFHYNQENKIVAMDSLLVSGDYCANQVEFSYLSFEEGFFHISQYGLVELNMMYYQKRDILEVNLSNARLTDLPYYSPELKKASHWDLSKNYFFALPVGLPWDGEISFLDLSYNSLERLDLNFIAKQKLTGLSLANNMITSFTDPENDLQVRSIDLSNNLITQLPKKLNKWKTLEELILTGNPIEEKEKKRISKKLPNTHVVF